MEGFTPRPESQKQSLHHDVPHATSTIVFTRMAFLEDAEISNASTRHLGALTGTYWNT